LRLEDDTDAWFDQDDIDEFVSLPSPPPLRLNVSSITTLTLDHLFYANGSSLHPLLQRLPNLHLRFQACSVDFSLPNATPSNPTLVHLPNLRVLAFQGRYKSETCRNEDSTVFLLPNLQELVLHNEETPIELLLFPPSPHPPNINSLQILDLSSPYIPNESLFLDQLARLHSLKELNISHPGATNATLERLVWPKDEVVELGGRGGEGESDEGICPRLDTLTMSMGYDETISTAGTLIRMLVSRGRSSFVGGGCVSIETLKLEGDPDSWDGMEESVLRDLVGRFLVEE